MPHFGDSLKSNTIRSSCTPRRRGQALSSHEILLRMQGLGLDGVAIASHPTPDVLIHPGDTSLMPRPASCGTRG